MYIRTYVHEVESIVEALGGHMPSKKWEINYTKAQTIVETTKRCPGNSSSSTPHEPPVVGEDAVYGIYG